MKYDFSEKLLGPDFCKNVVGKINHVIQAGSSFTIIGIPYIGGILFFRYLVMTNIAYFVLIDVHALQAPTKEDFFFSLYRELGGKELEINKYNILEKCKAMLQKILKKEKKIVILINQINYLKHEFSNGFLLNIRTLEDFAKGKIIFIISSTKPLYNYTQISNYERGIGIASKNIYFLPYSKIDLEKFAAVYPLNLRPKQKDLARAMELSGGHSTLFHILLKTNSFDKPFEDEQIPFHLNQIYNEYTTLQKTQLRKVALGRRIKNVDPFLLKIGLIKEIKEDQYELFTPLLRDYILTYAHTRLTRKERKLFFLLKKNLDKLVTKDQIFKEVWGDDPDLSSDWALNSLIYRLRKNPTFVNQGYVIENEKDEGYRMSKEN